MSSRPGRRRVERLDVMHVALGLSMILLLAAGCSPADERDRAPSSIRSETTVTPETIKSDGDERAPAPAPDPASNESTAPPGATASPGAMPEAIRGQWRENDLGRDPTAEDCDQTSPSNRNFGKVLTVNAGGYSLFEDGGRIIHVHGRTDRTIDAAFDTTYADTLTRARRAFALQPGGALAVKDDRGSGRSDLTEYLRCP